MLLRRRAAALLATAALVLTACPARDEPPSSSPVPGGTLVVALRSFGTLDPAAADDRGSLLGITHVFEPLTHIDADGALRPAAASKWSVTKSGLRWRFRIAPARFHDGSPVTAADFKFAFDRIARKKTDSSAAFQLSPVVGFGDVHDSGKRKTLRGVIARARDLLEIRLDRPYAELPYALAHPALVPLPVKKYERTRSGLSTNPVGNGPFRVRNSRSAKGATLVRNDSYPGTASYLDAIELRVMKAGDGWQALLDGRVHVADVPGFATQTARSRFGASGFTSFWATLEFGFNLELRKYAKPEVRRAISLAIDRRAIAEGIYGNTKEAATGIIPRGVRGYVPDSCTACAIDRDRARQIIRAAFGARPPAIRIDHLSDATSRRVATAIANDLRAVGFRATLKGYSQKAYLRLLQKRDHDFAELAWLSVVSTPDGFLAQQLRTGSPDNNSRFKDPSFDRAIQSARRTSREAGRLEYYRRAEARALELMPLVPIVFFRNRTAAAPSVRDYALDGAGLFDAAKIWLAR